MPTGLRNVVCDECSGGRIAYLPTGEIQLEHQPECMWKYREDTFLIDLQQGLDSNRVRTYPDVKLNPIIYDMLCDGYFTEPGNKTFTNHGMTKAQKKAQRINENFQLIKQALKEDGRWP